MRQFHLKFLLFSLLGSLSASSASAEPVRCEQIFSRVLSLSDIQWGPITVVKSDFDVNSLTAEDQLWVRAVLSFAEMLQQNPYMPINEVVSHGIAVISVMPEHIRAALLGKTFEKLWRLKYMGDMKLFLDAVDEFVKNEDFDQWTNAVFYFQQAALKSDSKAHLPEEEHPSWMEFNRKMGIVPYAEAHQMFSEYLPWISPKSLRKHLKKRNERDGYALLSEEELVLMANQFLQSWNDSQIVFRQNETIVIKFDRNSQELAVVSAEGKIITYYLLDESYRKDQSTNYFLGHALLGLQYKRASE